MYSSRVDLRSNKAHAAKIVEGDSLNWNEKQVDNPSLFFICTILRLLLDVKYTVDKSAPLCQKSKIVYFENYQRLGTLNIMNEGFSTFILL